MTEEKLEAPAKKKLGTHLCDRCGKNIECTSKDPVHSTSLGIFHGKCMLEHYQAIRDAETAKEVAKAAKKVVKKKIAKAKKEKK
jgi:hypothetical protein